MPQVIIRNRSRLIRLAVVLCAVGGFFAAVAVAEDVWVTRPKAALLTEKSSFGDVVVDVSKGDKLTVLERDGNWLKVRIGDKEGYVTASAVSAEQVSKPLFTGGSDASALASANASRGLGPEEFAKSRNLSPDGWRKIQANRVRLLTLEKQNKVWEQFQREGAVGQYKPKTGN